MMYSFAKPEAVRSFREAWKRDPNCAICYWGEAWAWGSYLNGPMNADEAPHAYAAIQKAIALKAMQRERNSALIEAMSVRYVEKFDRRQACRTRQSVCRGNASGRGTSFPTIWKPRRSTPTRCFFSSPGAARETSTIRTSSGCIRCSSRFWRKTSTIPAPVTCTCTRPNPRSCPHAPKAAQQFLGRSIPGASHINHMPSHTWNEVGRWGDSVRANHRGLAFGSEGRSRRRIRDLSRTQPAHAAVCRVDGRAGRRGHTSGKGLREADRRHVLPRADACALRPLRRGARGQEPAAG